MSMEAHCSYVDYEQTGYFSKLVTDYLKEDATLKPFYNWPPTAEGLKQAIEHKKSFKHRSVLVEQLKKQYNGLNVSASVTANINALLNSNTFTVTTAHQPNIFSGPLYVVYKIFHAVKLAEELKTKLPEYNFVPVYFVGSEDADLEELNNITINQRKYVWETKQTGSVGRMKADKKLTQLMHEIDGQLSVLPFGNEVMEMFRNAYKEGNTIQQASLTLLNSLFGNYGLIVLIADTPELKKIFQPVIEKELKEQFSHKAVTETAEKLEAHYKLQAAGREINLFYLIDDKRERIELQDSKYKVESLQLEWSLKDVLKEVEEHPERFSPNVILRGVYQETILPNIAFIGGGGELAYWIELKKVFEQANVPYPVLLLRNSFLIIDEKQNRLIKKIGFTDDELFLNVHDLMKKIVSINTNNGYALNGKLETFEELYNKLQQQATNIDETLKAHVESLKTKTIKKLTELEKKMLRAEKKKFSTEQGQLEKIKSVLFPNNSLQERVENFSGFYALKGNKFLNDIFLNSKGLDQKFAILTYN